MYAGVEEDNDAEIAKMPRTVAHDETESEEDKNTDAKVEECEEEEELKTDEQCDQGDKNDKKNTANDEPKTSKTPSHSESECDEDVDCWSPYLRKKQTANDKPKTSKTPSHSESECDEDEHCKRGQTPCYPPMSPSAECSEGAPVATPESPQASDEDPSDAPDALDNK